MTPRPRDRVEIFGCQVDVLTMDAAIERCDEIMRSGGPGQHMAVNTAKLVAMQKDARLRAAVNRCDVITADGQGIVLAIRLLHGRRVERVTGIDLMDGLM